MQLRDGAFTTRELSQGQRKRLALVVAYLEDRPIVLFDEWAADQDPAFKEVFYRDVLRELRERGKAVIVVSHDDRYFHFADQLICMEGGQVVSVQAGQTGSVQARDRPRPGDDRLIRERSLLHSLLAGLTAEGTLRPIASGHTG